MRISKRLTLIGIASFTVFFAAVAGSTLMAQEGVSLSTGKSIAILMGSAPMDQNASAPRIPQTEETDRRRARNYPEQPPIIPHKIDGYQLDMNGNQCLSCHARGRVEESGAPMVSVTHFMDRDGQALATVSPRRYFCNQCHVVQARVPALINNTFVDVDTLLSIQNQQ